jgi:hypothetical protein
MSYYVASGYRIPISKHGDKGNEKKSNNCKKTSVFFDLFTNFAYFSRKTPSETQKSAHKLEPNLKSQLSSREKTELE